jgi:hypothetical protein
MFHVGLNSAQINIQRPPLNERLSTTSDLCWISDAPSCGKPGPQEGTPSAHSNSHAAVTAAAQNRGKPPVARPPYAKGIVPIHKTVARPPRRIGKIPRDDRAGANFLCSRNRNP